MPASNHPLTARLRQVPHLVERLGSGVRRLADQAVETHARRLLDAAILERDQFGIELHDVGLVRLVAARVEVDLDLGEHLGRRELADVGQVALVPRGLQPHERDLRAAQERIGIEAGRHLDRCGRRCARGRRAAVEHALRFVRIVAAATRILARAARLERRALRVAARRRRRAADRVCRLLRTTAIHELADQPDADHREQGDHDKVRHHPGERLAEAEVRQQRRDAETGREAGDRPEPARAVRLRGRRRRRRVRALRLRRCGLLHRLLRGRRGLPLRDGGVLAPEAAPAAHALRFRIERCERACREQADHQQRADPSSPRLRRLATVEQRSRFGHQLLQM